jgi:hypothetical protein
VARQRAVALVQDAPEALDFLAQAVGGVVVVVQVHLDLAVAVPAEPLQRIEVMRLVLFFRVEEGVLRGNAVGVAMPCRKARITIAPFLHATRLDLGRRPSPLRLVVVDEAEHHVHRSRRNARDAATQVGRQPDAGILALELARHEGRGGQQRGDGHEPPEEGGHGAGFLCIVLVWWVSAPNAPMTPNSRRRRSGRSRRAAQDSC